MWLLIIAQFYGNSHLAPKKLRTFANHSFTPINMTVWEREALSTQFQQTDFLLFFLINSGKSSLVTNNIEETKTRGEG